MYQAHDMSYMMYIIIFEGIAFTDVQPSLTFSDTFELKEQREQSSNSSRRCSAQYHKLDWRIK